MHNDEFRRCLEQVDVAGIRALWAHVSPHLPQPQTDDEARVTIHHARTQAQSLPIKARAYSHAWLTERGLPSGLPDELKPAAERLYPRVADAVGISVNTKSELLRPIVEPVRGAMSDAVLEAYADGRTDPAFVRARMHEARTRTISRLLGSVAGVGGFSN